MSNVIRDILQTHFSRVAPVIPNAIDTSVFYESAQQRKLMADAQAGRILAPRVLIVGHPGLPLKNFSTSLHVRLCEAVCV